MVYTISEIKEKAVPVAMRYGVKSMSLFGSYARGEADDDSDVDIYIDKGRLRGLFQYCGFISDLEDELKCHVDVITTGIKDTDFLASIKKDGILLYEE